MLALFGTRGAYNYRLDESTNTIVVRWFNNKVVNLVSSYADMEPVGAVRRYDRSLQQHVKRNTNIHRLSLQSIYRWHRQT